jgi:membrane protein DedA with SNARE-associated domain
LIAKFFDFKLEIFMGVLIGFVVILLAIGMLAQVGVKNVIVALITGGIGFALGDLAGTGWAIFGAILGALVGVAGANQ